MTQLNAYTPLYHEALDDWGLVAGTRIWDASGSFTPIEHLKPGQGVLGITFRIEKEYLNINPHPRDPSENIVSVFRPILCIREILEVRTVQARAWQLTFGDSDKMLESRRLVAGADTRVDLYPVTHRRTVSSSLTDLHTSVANPRTGSLVREAYDWDTQNADRPEARPSPFTGTPRGDLVVVVPYEHYAGQTGMMATEVRTYNRYVFTQAREVVPLVENTTLYQLVLKHDEKAEFGASPENRRCNVIAQTPFAPEPKTRAIYIDQMAQEVMNVTDPEAFKKQWDEWAQGRAESNRESETALHQENVESTMQGMFYETKNDPDKARAMEQVYGVRGGWLNGGILIDIPIPTNETL